MNEEIKQDYIKSGSIAKKAIEYSKQIVKPGENIYDICEKIESFIKENGAHIGFPVNISVNEIAAHDTGIKNDTRLITENDVVKIDIGTHVNGYVGDTAHTMHWNHDFDDLVNASKNALDEALKLCIPGTKISEIGEVIQNTIENAGFQPIRNLTGHGLEQYFLHADPQILNVKNNSSYVLKDGQVIAIEPFVTTKQGAGEIKESNDVKIYMLLENKPVRNRNSRILLNHIQKYENLPFATRWLPLSGFSLNMGMKELLDRGIIYDYPVLKEINNEPISQFEHSVLVGDKPLVLTR